jgi:hypothetical protein
MEQLNLIELKKITNKKLLEIYNDTKYKNEYINAFNISLTKITNNENIENINTICNMLTKEDIIYDDNSFVNYVN